MFLLQLSKMRQIVEEVLNLSVVLVTMAGIADNFRKEIAETGSSIEISNSTDGAQKTQNAVWETQNEAIVDSADSNPPESKEEGHSIIGKEEVLESLTGEHEYLSDYGTGRLTI